MVIKGDCSACSVCLPGVDMSKRREGNMNRELRTMIIFILFIATHILHPNFLLLATREVGDSNIRPTYTEYKARSFLTVPWNGFIMTLKRKMCFSLQCSLYYFAYVVPSPACCVVQLLRLPLLYRLQKSMFRIFKLIKQAPSV